MKNFNFFPKTKKRILILTLSVLAMCFLCLLAWTLEEVFFDSSDELVTVDIPEGASNREIAYLLEEKGVISSPFLFRAYSKLFQSGVYQSGVHSFYCGMSYGKAVKSLSEMSENTVTVTVPEGYELWQIAHLLEEKGVCSAEDFYEAQKSDFSSFPFLKGIDRENPLEGYLFPDTYEFERESDAKEVIGRMLSAFSEKVLKEYEKSGSEMSLDDIVILASMVEREAGNDGEMGLVASVFTNRLKIGMTLSSCATVQYVIKERKAVLSNQDIQIDSPYNTYKNKGLPIGPIASPGLSAVKAALNPEESDYLYFAAAKDGGGNIFSKTGEEHLKIVKELQK